jgi:hypothetical protein
MTSYTKRCELGKSHPSQKALKFSSIFMQNAGVRLIANNKPDPFHVNAALPNDAPVAASHIEYFFSG